MKESILRLPDVQNATGLSRSSIYALVSQGEFPKSVPLGPRAVGWLSTEVDSWIKSRISQRKAA